MENILKLKYKTTNKQSYIKVDWSPVCVTENSKSSRIAIESQPWQKGQSIHFQEAVSVIVIIVHWSFNRPKHRSKTAHGFRCCSSNLRLEIQDQSNNWQLIRSHLPWISIDFRLIQLTTRNTILTHSAPSSWSYILGIRSHVTRHTCPDLLLIFNYRWFRQETVETLLAVLFVSHIALLKQKKIPKTLMIFLISRSCFCCFSMFRTIETLLTVLFLVLSRSCEDC